MSHKFASTKQVFQAVKNFAFRIILGDLYKLWNDPLGLITKASLERPVTKYRITSTRSFMISDPEMIKELMLDHNKCYDKGTLAWGVISRVIGKSLFVSNGELWRKQRQIAVPAFKAERIHELSSIFVEVAKECAQRWKEKAEKNESVDVTYEMMTTTLTSAIRTLFGTQINNDEYAEITEGIPRVISHLANVISEGGLPFWIPTKENREFKRSINPINKLIRKIILHKRMESKVNTSDGKSMFLIDNLIQATDDMNGKALSDRELRDEVIGFFYAGHETTTVALTWIWITLSQQNGCLEEIREEIRKNIGERLPSFADLEHLEKLNRVILETMRLYPPVWLLERRAIKTNMLYNLKVKKDDFVGVCTYALHRNPKYWKDPNNFVPSRFEGEWRTRIDRYCFMPFGAGPRTCVGLSFAMIEMQLMLAYLIPRFNIEIPNASSIKPKAYLSLRTDRPAQMWLRRTEVPI